MNNAKRPFFIASPRGFCAGVRRALEALDHLLYESPGAPLYVCHEIVHNTTVVRTLESRGVRFVQTPEEVPENAPLVLSAHGVSRPFEERARLRTSNLYDATCPLVRKLQQSVARHTREGDFVILAGRRGHPEIEGCLGRAEGPVSCVESPGQAAALQLPADRKIVLLSQTTLVASEFAAIAETLRKRAAHFECPAGICYATANRQKAAEALAERCEVVLVLGSTHSSNARHLRDAAEAHGAKAFLLENASAIPPEVFEAASVGVTASASAPEELVQGCVEALCASSFGRPTELRVAEEKVEFAPVPTGKKPSAAV